MSPRPTYLKVNPRFFKSKSIDLLKLSCKISPLNVTLMNGFDKKIVAAFYNSFLKIELNCHKEIMLLVNACIFQKKMLSNVTCVLIYLLANFALEDV